MSVKKIQIQKKKNQINRWLEISLNQESSEHLQHMVEAMKQEKRMYFLEDEQILIYNTRELSKLETYLKENASPEDLCKILLSAIRLQETCINHLIPKESILFDFEYSYFDESKNELELIVLPLELSEAIYPFQDWILRLIEAFPFQEEHKKFLSRLSQLAQSQRFNIGSLKEELKREDRKRKEKTAFQVDKKKNSEALPPDEKKFSEPFLRREEMRTPPSFIEAPPRRKEIVRPEENFALAEERKPSERIEFSEVPKTQKPNEAMKKEKRKITYKSFFLYEMIMLIALGFASFYAYSIYANPKKAILGLAIIWGMINYMIGKELLKYIKKHRAKEEVKQNDKSKAISSHQDFAINEKITQRAEAICKIPLCEETELLLEKNRVSYYLNDLKNKSSFKLEKRITLLGRKYEDVDIYLSDKSIGRVHAIFSIENSNIFLQDNDSLNGCFVNERRLGKNERTEIKEGDHLRFSTLEFLLCSTGA